MINWGTRSSLYTRCQQKDILIAIKKTSLHKLYKLEVEQVVSHHYAGLAALLKPLTSRILPHGAIIQQRWVKTKIYWFSGILRTVNSKQVSCGGGLRPLTASPCIILVQAYLATPFWVRSRLLRAAWLAYEQKCQY